jgi:hypothetical protein
MVKSWVFLHKTDISDTHPPVIYFLRASVRKDSQVIPHPQAIVHINKICVSPYLQEQLIIFCKSLYCEATSLLKRKSDLTSYTHNKLYYKCPYFLVIRSRNAVSRTKVTRQTAFTVEMFCSLKHRLYE